MLVQIVEISQKIRKVVTHNVQQLIQRVVRQEFQEISAIDPQYVVYSHKWINRVTQMEGS